MMDNPTAVPATRPVESGQASAVRELAKVASDVLAATTHRRIMLQCDQSWGDYRIAYRVEAER
jgi:hypothetical protein